MQEGKNANQQTACDEPQSGSIVRDELIRLLDAVGVYDFNNYGWLNADDIDPEHAGHAAAQVASLADEVIDTICDEENGHTPQLTDWQKELIISEGDFSGFMQASRWSIGEMLLRADESDLFYTHFMSAMLLLGAASDRLREFFICAVFNKRSRSWRPSGHIGQAAIEYSEPFTEAQRTPPVGAPSSVAAHLADLVPLVHTIAANRRERHAIAHRVATAEGRRKQRLTRMTWAPMQEVDWSEIDFSKIIDPEYDDRQHSLARRVEPIAWYKNLIQVSNLVFLVEHSLRVRRRAD